MRIGLIGWYYHSNAGDDRMLACLRQGLPGADLEVTTSYDDAMARLDELNRCDYVLLGGGGLILRGFGRYATLFERLEVPFGCIGLGVDAKHRDNRALIEVLKERAEFIYVRDPASRDLLDSHYKVIVGPDITFLFPYDIVPWTSDDRCGVNLRPWPYWRFEFGGRLSQAMAALDRRIPALQSLYPLPRWQPQAAVKRFRETFDQVVAIPLYSEQGLPNDVTVLRELLTHSEPEFRPESMGECRFIVGMRLHCLIFACQMGIPFVSLTYQPKNTAFCEMADLSSVSASIYDPREVLHAITELKEDTSSVRNRVLEARARMVEEVQEVFPPLLKLIGTGGKSRVPVGPSKPF